MSDKKKWSNPFKNNLDEATDKDLTEQTENSEENTEFQSEETQNEQTTSDSDYNKLKDDYDNLNNQYLRLAADFDNFRKRNEQEREALLKFGTETALKKLLEVLDNFERGEKALEGVEDCQQVKDSFNLVHKQVLETLQKLGLEEIKAEGEEFDPNFHDAVMQTPTDEHNENTIIAELQKGYKYGDKVLRPTLVNVATKN